MSPPHQLVLGVDAATVGSHRGWAVVAAAWADGRLGPASAPCFVEHLADLVAPGPLELGGLGGVVRAIGIDIPNGLAERGWRGADLAGRHALAGRASTLFPMPPRGVLEEPNYGRANALSRQLTGKGLSKQSHGLRSRVLELDLLLRCDPRPGAPEWFEVHPELSFAALGGAVVTERKKTWAGSERRRALLERAGLLPPSGAGQAQRLATDDVLDAAVAVWSAARALAGSSVRYLHCPPTCALEGHAKGADFDPILGRELAIDA
ncbi:MAG: DUF429 domain-containing protein [Planctomycetota bacterium]|nr:DUF429 domain-containing protein [Planctomycetota bacterium]